MARSLASATPAFSNYGDGIHPVSKGGFGSNTIEGIKSNIDGLDRTVTSAEGGVIPIGTNGLANLAPYGISLNSVTIKGPKYFNRSTTTEYIITNYSSLKDYTVSISSGTATRNGSTITVSANIVPDAVVLTINNRNITLNKMPSPIGRPTVTLGGIAYNDNKVTITAKGTDFTSSNGKTHASSTWQIASDVLFTNILAESVNDTVNKTSYVFQAVDKVPTLYVRVTYKDSAGEVSEWSSVASINTSDLSIAVNTPSASVTGKKTSSGAKLTITGSMFVTADGGNHYGTTWQVSDSAAFTTILFESVNDTVNKGSIVANVTGTPATYYVRIKQHSSVGNVSAWSNPASINRAPMLINVPINEEAILTASPTYSVTYFGYNCVTDATGTRLLVTGNNGVMNIFVRNGSVWTVEFSYAFSAGSSYTNSCAIDDSGTRVFLSHTSGYVYIFVRNNTTWTLELQLTSSDSNTEYFGSRIATNPDGSIIVVTDDSKTDNGSSGKGSCYVYKRTGTSWSKVAKLNLSNTGTAYISFGSSMAYSEAGSTIILGSKFYSDYRVVWAFTGSGDTWSEGVLLPDPGGSVAKTVRFGDTLIISQDGTRIFVSDYAASAGNGSLGAVFCYVKSGNNWVYESTIISPQSNSTNFSVGSLSCNYDGSVLAVGSSYDPIPGNQSYAGRVFIYSRTGATWALSATITGSDSSIYNYFGQPISLAKNESRLFCASQYHGKGDIHVFS